MWPFSRKAKPAPESDPIDRLRPSVGVIKPDVDDRDDIDLDEIGGTLNAARRGLEDQEYAELLLDTIDDLLGSDVDDVEHAQLEQLREHLETFVEPDQQPRSRHSS